MQDPTTPTGNPGRIPKLCPYGHELTGPPLPHGTGRVIVGWTPCKCPPAAAEHGGHRIYHCRACLALDDKRSTICYFPPHVPTRSGTTRNGVV